jgi:hypothetical protein
MREDIFNAIVLLGGTVMFALPFVIMGLVVLWRERHYREEEQ